MSLEEGASLIGGTAASLVQEAVGDRQAPNDAIKQVIKDSEVWSLLRSKIQAARRYRRRSSGARSVKEVEDLKEWQMYGEDAEQHGGYHFIIMKSKVELLLDFTGPSFISYYT